MVLRMETPETIVFTKLVKGLPLNKDGVIDSMCFLKECRITDQAVLEYIDGYLDSIFPA